MTSDDALKVGDRVRHTGGYTPSLKGKTGVVNRLASRLGCKYVFVTWDDTVRGDNAFLVGSFTRIEPTKFKVGDIVAHAKSGVSWSLFRVTEVREDDILGLWLNADAGALYWPAADFVLVKAAPDTSGEAMSAGVLVGTFVKYRGNFVRVTGVTQRTRLEIAHASGTVETIDARYVAPVDDLPNAA